MRIQVKGRNVAVTDELRERVERRFAKVGKQVSELAVLEVELCEERNPSNPNRYVAEAILYLKGVTLRAKDASPDMDRSINLLSDEIAVQVKRHREKRRKRREARTPAVETDLPGGAQPAV
jgi:putative sigma-54 modulation protein